MLFGTYFFLSDIKYLHSRESYTVLDLLSDIGGFFGIILGTVALLGDRVNELHLNGWLIKSVYKNHSAKQISFQARDYLTLFFHDYCCSKIKLNHNQTLF